MNPVNLWLRPEPTNPENPKPCGKAVELRFGTDAYRRPHWAFHADAKAEWSRRDSGSLGLNTGLVDWCESRRVEHLYLLLRRLDVVYSIRLEKLLRYGIEQRHPGWGTTLNVQIPEWTKLSPFKTPWVPGHVKVVVPVRVSETANNVSADLTQPARPAESATNYSRTIPARREPEPVQLGFDPWRAA